MAIATIIIIVMDMAIISPGLHLILKLLLSPLPLHCHREVSPPEGGTLCPRGVCYLYQYQDLLSWTGPTLLDRS